MKWIRSNPHFVVGDISAQIAEIYMCCLHMQTVPYVSGGNGFESVGFQGRPRQGLVPNIKKGQCG